MNATPNDTGVFQIRVQLILKLFAVDRCAAATSSRRISRLDDEVTHNAVDLATIIIALHWMLLDEAIRSR